ncbi:Ig-like domain-containing protein [Lactobacillus acetotolerans]|uniref:Ig-like domain-containing protein n=1 Tax=Lactobacillus acetotolerans TaxID=1600 RepID=UPI002FDA76D2
MLSQQTLTLAAGANKTITASAVPDGATMPTVAWTSSDETVATVNADGTVNGVAAGTATITATAGEFTATLNVTVKASE